MRVNKALTGPHPCLLECPPCVCGLPAAVGLDNMGRRRPMLGSIAGDIRFKEPLSVHTSLRLGGPADVFIEVASVPELMGILRACARHAAPVFFAPAAAE